MATWFQDFFGFEEDPQRINDCLSLSTHENGDYVLTASKGAKSGQKFRVGKFTTPSSAQLREEISSAGGTGYAAQKGVTFENVTANVQAVHTSKAVVAGSGEPPPVIQAASQFNCLEMVGPSVTPSSGVTQYFRDKTQGPACAMCCPAGTVFRNYFP